MSSLTRLILILLLIGIVVLIGAIPLRHGEYKHSPAAEILVP